MTQDESTIPYGYCKCGCGGKTTIALYDNPDRGHVKGEPRRFLKGHHSRAAATRAKNSSSQRKRWMDNPELRAAMSAVHKGRTISVEHRAAISKANSGKNNHRWTGGRQVTEAGYVLIHVGRGHPMETKGYVLEHRLVMAEHIGRMLEPEEIVHHKTEAEGGSGRRDDNRIENLLLLPSHAAHRLHHFALTKAARDASS